MSGRGGDFDEPEPTAYERREVPKPHWHEFEMKVDGPRLGYVTFASHEAAAQFENSDGTPLQPLPEIGPNVFETRGPIRSRRVVDSDNSGPQGLITPLHRSTVAVSEADSYQQAPVSTPFTLITPETDRRCPPGHAYLAQPHRFSEPI